MLHSKKLLSNALLVVEFIISADYHGFILMEDTSFTFQPDIAYVHIW